MPDPASRVIGTLVEPADIERLASTTLTARDRQLGRWACYVFFALSLAYVPAMGAGFGANGGFSAPIRDLYLAVMELLILPLAVSLVVVLPCAHTHARPRGHLALRHLPWAPWRRASPFASTSSC